jgi:23S rRNA pseudouridine2605 synthase
MKNRPGSGGQQTPQEVRLNKFIANTGVCSRRDADTLIKSGAIKVNGKTITELGTKVGPQDVVTHKGKRLLGEKKVYILLNKPKDYLTTVKDTHGRKTVLDLVRGCCPERIYPVGRLDRNTTGVLLFTNDGALAEALTHPSYNRKKVYHVFLDKNLKTSDLTQISNGVELEDGFIRPDSIHYADGRDKKQVGIEIHSGRNRIVRRIFEHLGYRIEKLDRVYFAGLSKKGVSRGHWRHLTDKEIAMLKMSVPGSRRKKPLLG